MIDPKRSLLGLLAALLLLLAVRAWTPLAEAVYDSGVVAAPAFALSWLFSWLPVASADWMLALAVVLLVVLLTRLGFALRRREARVRRLMEVLGVVACVLAVFVFLFGVVYARGPVEERWRLPEVRNVTVEGVAAELVEATNAAYVALHGSEDLGSPTAVGDVASLDRTLEASLHGICLEREEAAHLRWSRPRARRPWVSPLMDRLGLSGFYFPWSGEANVNRGLPAISLVHALSHEKAHQRGFAPEDEANFVAVLSGLRSGDPLARYVALLFAQRQMLRRMLADGDQSSAAELIELRLPGVQRDIDDQRAYWERFRGPMQDFAHRTNDAYLKAQRVEGGVQSYEGSLGLLLRLRSEEPELFAVEGEG